MAPQAARLHQGPAVGVVPRQSQQQRQRGGCSPSGPAPPEREGQDTPAKSHPDIVATPTAEGEAGGSEGGDRVGWRRRHRGGPRAVGSQCVQYYSLPATTAAPGWPPSGAAGTARPARPSRPPPASLPYVTRLLRRWPAVMASRRRFSLLLSLPPPTRRPPLPPHSRGARVDAAAAAAARDGASWQRPCPPPAPPPPRGRPSPAAASQLPPRAPTEAWGGPTGCRCGRPAGKSGTWRWRPSPTA